MRRLAAKPVLAVLIALSLAASLSACGRKGPLDIPSQSGAAPAPVRNG